MSIRTVFLARILKDKAASLLLIFFTCLFVAVIWLFGIRTNLDARQSILDNESLHLVRLAAALTSQTEKIFSIIQKDLKILDLWIQQNPTQDPRTSTAFLELVDTLRESAENIIDYRLVDRTGALFYLPANPATAQVNVSDRKYVLTQTDPATRGFYIGDSVKSRVTGKWGIPISYPVSLKTSPVAVIFAALELDKLNTLYEDLRPKPNGAISLATMESHLLTRAPLTEALLGQVVQSQPGRDFLASSDLSAVKFQISPVDGMEKIVAYARPTLKGPFQISCSVAVTDVLAVWNQRFGQTLWALGLLSLLILLFGFGLLVMLSNLAKATASKTRFLTHMSHELRTPLNGILGLIQIFPRANLSAEQADIVDDLGRSGINLRNIVNEILDWTQLESRKMVSHVEVFSLPALLTEVLHLLSPVAAEKGLGLDLSLAPDCPEWLSADARKLRHILENLTSNALKFTTVGWVKISGITRGHRLILAVQDTGPGITAETQARLFKPFQQGDQSYTRKYAGTGLGLAISQELAHLLGGQIHLETVIGQGSTFTLDLPLTPASPPRPAADQAAPAAPDFSGQRVLVVEDTALNTKILVRLLQNHGITTETALNGAEAVQLCAQKTFDLVFMDIQMPVMDGYEATARIRQLNPVWQAIPIIALSAHALPEERAICLARGMNGHLAKPLTRESLDAILVEFLAR